jgi:hypothetical protein
VGSAGHRRSPIVGEVRNTLPARITDAEARRRPAEQGPNKIADRERQSWWRTLRGIATEPMLAAAIYLKGRVPALLPCRRSAAMASSPDFEGSMAALCGTAATG